MPYLTNTNMAKTDQQKQHKQQQQIININKYHLRNCNPFLPLLVPYSSTTSKRSGMK